MSHLEWVMPSSTLFSGDLGVCFPKLRKDNTPPAPLKRGVKNLPTLRGTYSRYIARRGAANAPTFVGLSERNSEVRYRCSDNVFDFS